MATAIITELQTRSPHNPDLASNLVAHSRPSAVTPYNEGAVIYAQGDASGPLYLVEYGAVRVHRLTYDGRRQISAFHFAGEVFGFEADGEHHFYAESIDRAGVRTLRPFSDGNSFEGILPLALQSLTRAQEHLLVLGRHTAMEKVASFLVDLHVRQGEGGNVYLPMQRADIADYLGLTFETVSRMLRKLIDARTIRLTSTKDVQILNLEALEDLSQ